MRNRCVYIVPEFGLRKKQQCKFVARYGSFCKRHRYIFDHTGLKEGLTAEARRALLSQQASKFLEAIRSRLNVNELEELRFLLGVRTPLKDEAWENKFDNMTERIKNYESFINSVFDLLKIVKP